MIFESEQQSAEERRALRDALAERALQEAMDKARCALFGPRPEARPDACARATSMLPRLTHLLASGDAAGALDVLRSMGRALK